MTCLPRRTNLRILLRRPGALLGRYRWALAVLVIGAAADFATTYRNMRQFGPEVELHPAQRMVSEVLGVTAGVPVAKLIQLAFVIGVACWWRPWCGPLMAVCGLVYAAAAVSNHFRWL
jgi:hypothetical protein